MRKKKANILILVLFALFPLFLMGGGLFFCCRTTGFSLDKIISGHLYNPAWEIEPISELQRELLVQKVFPQTYYYLASGNQCYAFISEDREYVLKFFKMQNLLPKGWFNSFPLSLLQHLGIRHETGNRLFSERIFANYKDAYESLRKETGLIYIHFNKSQEFKTGVTLIDNKGKKYIVYLDAVEFVVQRGATRIYDHLNALLRERNYDDLKSAIRSFLKLIATRCEKGFVDQDLTIRNNIGFVGNTAIQFDCGTLTRDSSMKYPLNFRKEIMEGAERLNVWAHENCPEITMFIQDEAQVLINHSF